MFTISTDISNLDEIIKKSWPNQGTDAAIKKDESDWDILNETSNENVGSNRHWFKQNFVNQMPQSSSRLIYH